MSKHFDLDPQLEDFLRRNAANERSLNHVMISIQIGYLRVIRDHNCPFDQPIPVAGYLFNPAWIDPRDEWWNPGWVPGYHLTFTLANGREFGFMLFIDENGKIDDISIKDYWATREWLRNCTVRAPYIRDIIN